MKLKQTHYEQLLFYINESESDGWYYGNKEQFFKRHKELKEWVESLIKKDRNETTLRSTG